MKAKQTKTKRDPVQKELREDLKNRKAALEEKGYLFSLDVGSGWEAVKGLDKFGVFGKLEELLSEIEGLEEAIDRYKPRSGDAPPLEYLPGDVRTIEIYKIAVSRFEPQARRRARFDDEETFQLGESIRKKGLRQPILLRPVKPLDDFKAEFEIVFGERRFLASKLIGAKTIRAFCEDLTDAEVLELQYEENHRRMENSPLDDGFLFKFLIENENYTPETIADKFGKSVPTVKKHLKLNELIEEAVHLFEKGTLPFRHALYLAKFPPETQKEILEKDLIWRYQNEDEGIADYETFKEEIEDEVLLKLSEAAFDGEDVRLHLKGLKCSQCPKNSEYEKVLFPEFAGVARCTDKKCFDFKTDIHLQLKRDEIALKQTLTKPLDEAVKEVPLVTTSACIDKTDVPFKEKVLTSQKIYQVPECEFSVPALAVKGEEKGQEVYICNQKSCGIHNPKIEKETKTKTVETSPIYTENIFFKQVRKETRRGVFTEAVEYFNKNAFWLNDDLIQSLINMLLHGCGWDTYAEVKAILKDKKMPETYSNDAENMKWIKLLTKEAQSKVLFVLTFRTDGFYENSDLRKVKEIASAYTKKGFKTIEAETVLRLAPDEFKPEAQIYLEKVKRGETAEIPRFWTKGGENDE